MELSRQQKDVLGVVELDAELTAREIARRCRLQTATVQRIFARLVQMGFIVGRTAVIDVMQLGLIEHGVNFSFGMASKAERESVMKYLFAKPEVSWLAVVGGRFDIMCNVVARSPRDVVSFLRRFSQRFPAAIGAKMVCQRTERMRFWRGYWGKRQSTQPRFHMGLTDELVRIDDVDRQVLLALSAVRFESHRELARRLEIPPATFLRRVQALKSKKVLAGFGYRLNLDLLGIQQFRVLLSFRDVSSAVRAKLMKISGENGHVKLLVATLGSWDFELEVDAVAGQDMPELTSDLREAFGDALSAIEVIPIFTHVKFISFPAV